MTTAPVDTRLALDSVNSQDLVQKKVALDAMKKRVNGGASEEKQLREACEGFESIFLQRMWEQMRKNVKKEGYLHSKDEEAYQGLFDTELAKKMASAGGVGLGDMLYEQLSQKLTNTSRTTGTGAMRAPLPINPGQPLREPAVSAVAPAAKAVAPENLYSDVEPAAAEVSVPLVPQEPAAAQEDPVAAALAELAAEQEAAMAEAAGPAVVLQPAVSVAPVADPPMREVPLVPLPQRVSAPGKARPSRSGKSIRRTARNSQAGAANPQLARMRTRNAAPEQTDPTQATSTIQAAPAAAPGQITPAPVAPGQALPGQNTSGQAASATPASASTGGASWPVAGDIVRGYGRETGPDGTSSWSTGVQFAAFPGAAVTAPASGSVAFAGEKNGLPHVVLRHEDGTTSHYANARSLLAEGEVVVSGMQFATVGAGEESILAGSAENRSRMGFELRRGELALNPERLLA